MSIFPPSTLAKDCAKLIKAGFKIEYVQPVDMFPITGKVEAEVKLVLKGTAE